MNNTRLMMQRKSSGLSVSLICMMAGALLVFSACAGSDRGAGVWEDARRSGVDFRAIGQEPGWLLEIREGERITFAYDYGQRRAITPAPAPQVDAEAGRTVYRPETEAHTLEVVITDAPCRDVMSGERFPATVTVTLDGQTYQGCGRALR